MSTQSQIYRGDFKVGDVLATSIGITFRRFFFFVSIAFVFKLPDLIFALQYPYMDAGYRGADVNWTNLMLYQLIHLLSMGLIAAVVSYAVVKELQGQTVSFSLALQKGLSRGLPAIVTILLVAIVTVIGLMLFIIPGWILTTVLWVAIPAAVVERKGPVDSMLRSAALTKGRRWKIFGVVLIIGLGVQVITQIVSVIIFKNASSIDDGITTLTVTMFVVEALLSAWLAVIASYGYYQLVVEKDGTDIDMIAAIFDLETPARATS